MKCPACPDAILVMSARDGVEIDYCPNCRGVWLDRGELDKIIERSSQEQRPTQAERPASAAPTHRPDFVDSDFSSHKQGYGYEHGRRKKSWLNQIFD